MVVDFGAVKRALKTWIDGTLDHRMLLRKDDPLVEWLEEHDEPVVPFDDNPTAENIARAIFERTREEGLPVLAVRLWETPSSYATYTG
jgi:6-pyruvoyltetrahydropterin/6-carboxytetrahydropterin synthase